MADAVHADAFRTVYREVTAEFGPDGGNRSDILDRAAERLAAQVRSGMVEFDYASAIRAELVKVDESEGKRADNIIRAAATGQGEFQITTEVLDVVVTLGAGLRKQWRDVTAKDLEAMNEIRYRNYRNVKSSYEEWFQHYRSIRAVVFKFATFGVAVEQGGFPPRAKRYHAA